jgi:hypothetical protein
VAFLKWIYFQFLFITWITWGWKARALASRTSLCGLVRNLRRILLLLLLFAPLLQKWQKNWIIWDSSFFLDMFYWRSNGCFYIFHLLFLFVFAVSGNKVWMCSPTTGNTHSFTCTFTDPFVITNSTFFTIFPRLPCQTLFSVTALTSCMICMSCLCLYSKYYRKLHYCGFVYFSLFSVLYLFCVFFP